MAKDKPQSEQPVSQWSLDDMGNMQAEIEAQAATMARMDSILTSVNERLIAQEKVLAGVSLEDRMLPSDVVNGLDPAQIFSIALNAAITASLLAQPVLHSQPEGTKRVHVRNAINYAEIVLAEMLSRAPGKRKSA